MLEDNEDSRIKNLFRRYDLQEVLGALHEDTASKTTQPAATARRVNTVR